MKVQSESFHLNGHIIEFRPQTQKLESLYKSPSSTLAVKKLKATGNTAIIDFGFKDAIPRTRFSD